jgi:hypothetical protein
LARVRGDADGVSEWRRRQWLLSCPIQHLIGVLRDSSFSTRGVIRHPSLTTPSSLARHGGLLKAENPVLRRSAQEYAKVG